MKLNSSFYLRDDVVQIARDLVGKYLFTNLNGEGVTGGLITETEAYAGITDRASHAWNGRRTNRSEIMFRQGGCAYVYLCYGIHSLFNVVTNRDGVPDAVLVRGILPFSGLELMMHRTGSKDPGKLNGSGPGRVSSLLGIHYSHSGTDLLGRQIWLEDQGLVIPAEEIITGPRVGVDYAGQDALRPYRFRVPVEKIFLK
jgi:DNA-3-methyladenine glycosylase